MKKLILLTICAALVGCDRPTPTSYHKGANDQLDTRKHVSPPIRYIYDLRTEVCYYYASEWHAAPGSTGAIAGTMVLQPIECTDKIKAAAETIGSVENSAH